MIHLTNKVCGVWAWGGYIGITMSYLSICYTLVTSV